MPYRAGGPIAIVGAGPYGLSIAAHFQLKGIEFRIFGSPMHRWLAQMPKGMFLKSEGCGSNLSDPSGRRTLAHYCAENGLAYGDWGTPVPRESFARYALAFQRELVPNVEDVSVVAIERSPGGFALRLSTGEAFDASKVIMATGLEHTDYIPEALRKLPSELCSHSSEHHDLSRFKGLGVTVVGGGQSALETAALLAEQGADVSLLVREPSVAWNPDPDLSPRSLYRRLRYPRSDLGEGLSTWIYCNLPQLFHSLPRQTRIWKATTTLGPAGAWWLKERIIGRFPVLSGHLVVGAEAQKDRALLKVMENGSGPRMMTTDHVIAATGYQFDLKRLPFLSESLKSQLRHEEWLPKLSANFESSVPGLYFTGLASMYSLGPAMRFLAGTTYAASRITGHIAACLGSSV
jgi:cation diffusion facilitator CzcD-associated flavoprotein CzcO